MLDLEPNISKNKTKKPKISTDIGGKIQPTFPTKFCGSIYPEKNKKIQPTTACPESRF